MAEHEQKICEICHQRPATLHLCDGNTSETSDLCLICFEQTASAEELASQRHTLEAIRTGKCQYCGSPAATGSFFSGVPGVMEGKAEFWCKQCNTDLVEFHARPENAIPNHDYP